MMYAIVRLIFWALIFVVVNYLVVYKSNIVNKKIFMVSIFILCAILASASAIIPVENLFVTFDTPEDVAKYYARGEIIGSVDGKESTLLILFNSQESSGSHIVIPRTQNGYKIPSIFTVKNTQWQAATFGTFQISSVLGTNDYYIVGIIISEEEMTIRDNDDNLVKTIAIWIPTSNIFYISFYAYIESLSDDYYLIIGDEKFVKSEWLLYD
ncbi:MAG: hypothetical protein LBC73_11190 [Oscillospiraceae bacterium]|nr:hypothetical protein [Oscillospiraceae bacterium]